MRNFKRYIPILSSLFLVVNLFFYVKNLKEKSSVEPKVVQNIGSFHRESHCGKQPNFLTKLHIKAPVAIDLSQQRYKGLAFLHGKALSKVLHLKTWEQFDYFSSYALTPTGNMFLTPMPYISVKEQTFEFQKNIYKLHSNSGKLEVWLHLDEVHPSSNNPYGIIALTYDCDDNSLWISSLDETDYTHNRGVIYHVDVASKKILQRVEGVDALSLKLIKSEKGKFLLAGMARENSLNAYAIVEQEMKQTPLTLFNIGESTCRIRKISVIGKNQLKLKTIPFSYSLIAQTQEGNIRKTYTVLWDSSQLLWDVTGE